MKIKQIQDCPHLNVNNLDWLDDVKESRIILFLVRLHHPAISVAWYPISFSTILSFVSIMYQVHRITKGSSLSMEVPSPGFPCFPTVVFSRFAQRSTNLRSSRVRSKVEKAFLTLHRRRCESGRPRLCRCPWKRTPAFPRCPPGSSPPPSSAPGCRRRSWRPWTSSPWAGWDCTRRTLRQGWCCSSHQECTRVRYPWEGMGSPDRRWRRRCPACSAPTSCSRHTPLPAPRKVSLPPRCLVACVKLNFDQWKNLRKFP